MLPRTKSPRSPLFFRAFLVPGLASAALGLAAAPAAADPAEKLHVTVHADGKGCISSEKLQTAVEKRAGAVAKHTDIAVHIEAADPGPGWVADVQVAGRAGRRTVSTKNAACSRLDDSLVLVVTLLADPEGEDPPAAAPKKDEDAKKSDKTGKKPVPDPDKGGSWGADDDPADDPADDDQPPQKDEPQSPKGQPSGKKAGGPNDKVPGAETPDKDDPENKGKKPGSDKDDKAAKIQFGIGAGAVYATGLVLGGLPGGRVSLSWLSPTPVAIEAGATLFAPYSGYQNGPDVVSSYQVHTMQFDLLGCPLRIDAGPLHFGACGGVTLTHFDIEQQDTPTQDPQDPNLYFYSATSHDMFSPTADLRLDVSLFSFLRAGVGLGAMVPVNPPNFAVWTGFYSNNPVILQGRAGITFIIPP